MEKQVSRIEDFKFLVEEKIIPDRLILKYNVNQSRAKVVISGIPVMITNYMKMEKAQKVIDDYKRYYNEVIN